MADNIEDVIKSAMGGAQNAPQPPRSLVPYLMTASEILRADLPPQTIFSVYVHAHLKLWDGICTKRPWQILVCNGLG
jgi:hypothetical protein